MYAFDADGQRLPQICKPGVGEPRFTRLLDVDTSEIEMALGSLESQLQDAEAEVEAAVAVLIEQFEEQLRAAQEQIHELHWKLDGLVRHQLVTEWAWLEADFMELVDMIAIVHSGDVLDRDDHAALREAVRHASLSVLRARGELTDLLKLARAGKPEVAHVERLDSHLRDPMLRYWLQSYVRGQVQLMVAYSLLLYACPEQDRVRTGQLRQRLLSQSRTWTADAEALIGFAKWRADVPEAPVRRKLDPRRFMPHEPAELELNGLLEAMELEVQVVAAPLTQTWVGLPASVGVRLPMDLT